MFLCEGTDFATGATLVLDGGRLLEERPEACNAAIRRFLAGATEDQVREAALATPS